MAEQNALLRVDRGEHLPKCFYAADDIPGTKRQIPAEAGGEACSEEGRAFSQLSMSLTPLNSSPRLSGVLAEEREGYAAVDPQQAS